MSGKIEAAHNAARILANLASSHLSKASRDECENAANEIYRVFGEPALPITSAGGNYFEVAAPVVERQPADKSKWDTASNPVLGYADSYRQMARTGTTSIDVWSIITDLERNIAPLFTSPPAPVADDMVRLLTRARTYARGEFRDEIDACLAGKTAQVAVAIDERAEFENYYRDRIMGNRTGVRFLRSSSGAYLDREVAEMWSGWQARSRLNVKELNK